MKHLLLLSLTAIAALGFSLSACGGSSNCVEVCVGDQIRHCVDGVLGDAEDCDVGMCMIMDDGMQHCMAPMGDDDDSGMNM